MITRRLTAAAGVAVLAVTGCGGNSANSSGGGSGGGGCSGSGDIVVGVIAPQSGAVASIVGSFTNGAKQAAIDINAAGGVCGGRHITIVSKDNTGDSTKDQSLAQQLVEQNGAKGVVMISDDDYANAGQYLQSKHVLDIGAYVSDALDDPANAIDTFSVAVPNKIEATLYSKFFFEKNHVKAPAVLYETVTAYGRTQGKSFCDAAQKNGTPCVDQETTTLDTTDVSAQIGNMKSKGADSILVEGFGIPVVKTIGTARAAGITGPILGTGTTATSVNLVAQFLPDQARQGYQFISYSAATKGNPAAATKLAAELKTLGPITEPLFVPMFSYDAVRLMAAGWKGANSLDGDDASAQIEKINEKAGTNYFLHDVAYSDKHHEPQLDASAETFCVATPLDDSGLATAAG